MRRSLLLGSSMFLIASTAFAQPFHPDPDTRDRVSFSVARTANVENDEMTVVLAAIHTDLVASVAAEAVNRAMQVALERVRKAEGVIFRSGSYSTRQIHSRPSPPSRPNEPRWHVEQELILASGDFDTLRALVTDLQSALALRSVGFALSDTRRIAVERKQSDAALRAFREEAERIREALGFAGYEIVDLQLSNGSVDPQQRHSTALMSAEGMGAVSRAPVSLEGGSSRVTGNVHARIQLLR
jgi:predicted secreted protein